MRRVQRWGRRAGLLVAALVWGAPSALLAAESSAPVPARPDFTMEEVEIRGEVERPGVFYIIPRREVPLDLGSSHKDYTAEIMEPLLPGPFRRQSQAGTGE